MVSGQRFRPFYLALLGAFVMVSAAALAADLGGGLRKAAEKGDTTMIQKLLAAGANVNSKDGHGRTPLFKAAENGRIAAVRLLLDAGANKIENSKNLEEDLRDAAKGGKLEKVQSLLMVGANPNSANSSGKTALMFAAESGHDQVVKLIIKSGADVSIVDLQQESALDMARHKKRETVVDLLQPELAKLLEEKRQRKEKQRREAVRATAEFNAKRRIVLDGYRVQKTTLDSFLGDGWNTVDVVKGRLGITHMTGVFTGSLTITIGRLPIQYAVLGSSTEEEKMDLDAARENWSFAQLVFGTATRVDLSALKIMGVKQSPFVVVCELRFDSGLLVARSCPPK